MGYPYPPLNAGTLEIGNGSLSFTHPASGAIEVYDSLPSPWQSGDTVRISASGDTFPSFTTDVPFPPRVTFLQPSFGSGPLVVNPGTLDVRWTPVDGSGTVEVMVSSGFQPDAAWAFTVVRCSAPIGQGQMQVPIASRGLGTSSDWVTLVFRVLNRRMVQAAGLNLDAIVASFDSGPIDLGGGTGGTGGTSGAAGTTGRGGAGGGGKGGGGAGGGATGRGGTGG